jgi:hypothetical protein
MRNDQIVIESEGALMPSFSAKDRQCFVCDQGKYVVAVRRLLHDPPITKVLLNLKFVESAACDRLRSYAPRLGCSPAEDYCDASVSYRMDKTDDVVYLLATMQIRLARLTRRAVSGRRYSHVKTQLRMSSDTAWCGHYNRLWQCPASIGRATGRRCNSDARISRRVV